MEKTGKLAKHQIGSHVTPVSLVRTRQAMGTVRERVKHGDRQEVAHV